MTIQTSGELNTMITVRRRGRREGQARELTGTSTGTSRGSPILVRLGGMFWTRSRTTSTATWSTLSGRNVSRLESTISFLERNFLWWWLCRPACWRCGGTRRRRWGPPPGRRSWRGWTGWWPVPGTATPRTSPGCWGEWRGTRRERSREPGLLWWSGHSGRSAGQY